MCNTPHICELDGTGPRLSGVRYGIVISASRRIKILFIVALFILTAMAPAFAADEDFDADYEMAWHNYNTGLIDEAVDMFKSMQKKYPGNSKLDLTLGTIYLELGDYGKAGDELRNALLHDPDAATSIWANIRLGHVLLKDGALDAAERNYRAGMSIAMTSVSGEPDALLEAAYGLQRVKVQRFLEGRYKSGRYLVHYFPFSDTSEDDLKWLVSRLEDAYRLINGLLQVKTDVRVDVYLYPNPQSFQNLFAKDAPIVYPEYGEIHEIIDKDYDYIEPMSAIALYWLQEETNRHGSGDFISDAIPFVIRGQVGGIDLSSFILALREKGYFVDLKLLRHEHYFPAIDKMVRGPEVASFIQFLRSQFGDIDIRQYLTQPNLEALYGMDVVTAQTMWLKWVEGKAADAVVDQDQLENIFYYIHKFDLVQIVPGEAEDAFKKGLELIGAGEEAAGIRQIERAIEIVPDFALAHYALGRLDFQRDNFERAGAHFETALESLTKGGTPWGWAHYLLGHIAEVREDYVGAIMHYERALEADVPLEVKVVAAEKLGTLRRVNEIAPSPQGTFEHNDFKDAVNLFSFIDLVLLNDRTDELEPYFATELNGPIAGEFMREYQSMIAPFDRPIVMHQVVAAESLGDFVKVKVILKLEVPEAEQGKITEFEEYLRLRKGITRYFLLLRGNVGLKIVDFIDQPSISGHARVLEESGTIIPVDGTATGN